MAKTKYFIHLNDSERSMLTQLICEKNVSGDAQMTIMDHIGVTRMCEILKDA